MILPEICVMADHVLSGFASPNPWMTGLKGISTALMAVTFWTDSCGGFRIGLGPVLTTIMVTAMIAMKMTMANTACFFMFGCFVDDFPFAQLRPFTAT